MRRARRDGQAGFTLMEVMIALAILATMMALVWGTITRTGAARRKYGAISERYRIARSALMRINRDLTMAFISQNEDMGAMDRRTYFMGESSGDVDTLTFSTLAHTRLYADANEGDQTVVRYYPAPDKENRRKTNLMRRELRRPGNEKFEMLPGEADILFPEIVKFEVTYWDWKDQDWKDEWDTQAADGPGFRLPDRIKVLLTFVDEGDHEVTLTTQVRTTMQESLNFYAN